MPSNYNIVSDLAVTANKFPDALAISVGREEITYGDLTQKAARLATALAPILKTKRVGILGSRSIAAYVGIAGACWAGATYVPLNMKWPMSRLISLMDKLQLDALVVDHNGAKMLTDEVLSHAPKTIFYGAGVENMAGGVSLDLIDTEPMAEPVMRSGEETAYIMFTSGTTGEPKGVVVSCGALKIYLDDTQPWTDLRIEDSIAEAHDITFDLSVHNTFLAWQRGASLHLMSALDMMAPQAFIRKREISVWMSVPTIINNMRGNNVLKHGMFPSLRLSIFCGEPLPIAAVQDWADAASNSVVENIYGPTEGTVVCTRQRLTNPPIVTQKRQILAIGEAYPNYDIAIVDPQGNHLPDGQTGEIAISSAQLADGYFNRPQQTAEKFRVIDGKRWYFTGDLGFKDENGIFHHMGRTDNQVKLKGNRVELEEVEMHLRRACETDLATVVAWPIVDGSAQGLVGFSTNPAMGAEEIRAKMAQTLPEYMVPGRVEIRADLPRNTNDKVDRNALVAELDSAQAALKNVEVPSLSPDNLADGKAKATAK